MISYEGHVWLVYSNKWGESLLKIGGPNKKEIKPFNYDIIHAYGSNTYRFGKKGNPVFSRKVIVTGDNLGEKHHQLESDE